MKSIPAKKVARRTYFHVSLLDELPADLRAKIEAAEAVAGVRRIDEFNVVRLDSTEDRLSFLNYPEFFDAPFPALRESWLVDIGAWRTTYRTYKDSANPPILHRKELLVPADHPRRSEYLALTEAGESIGLFDDPTRIGFQQQWEQLVRERGYQVIGHQLVPIGNDDSTDGGPSADESPCVARHLTALVRYGFSAPIQTLARYGFLDGGYTVFDYGCGRGDDMRGLGANGIQVGGWDPHYAPDNPVSSAHIVNLGFVINVIEKFDERVEAVHRAWSLAEQVLVVSVMLANQNAVEGQRYQDGILTRRGTFQKYYTQTELKRFLEQVLEEEPIAVGPGIFYVFRDKDAEQRFLAERSRSRRSILRMPSRPVVERPSREGRDRVEQKYQAFRGPLDRLWVQWLALGREPEKSEVADLLALTEGFGTLGKALRFIGSRNDKSAIEAARRARIADLEVYFALDQFQRRKPYKHLESGLQRDIKVFFGDYATAQQAARELLFRIASPEAVAAACQQAAAHGLGWLIEGESLQLHGRLVERLPPLLRVYVGCASVLYGDYRNADLIK
ncbi:DNA phosphorothioation-associated putative methyltransferase, partial [Steroidobacter sp.]|uniref:DNA phosphorothioation-associated putative methyltransferase n=1 Tax=Steroidobacter sp. TaxID=1978227 RepID=UPI001A5E3ED7